MIMNLRFEYKHTGGSLIAQGKIKEPELLGLEKLISVQKLTAFLHSQ